MVDLGVAAPVDELTFVEAAYVPRDGGFHLRLEYEGHTEVDGEFEAPALVFTGRARPVHGLRRHRDDLVARGAAPPVAERERPAWWTEPIFCGWGEQFHLFERLGRIADGACDPGELRRLPRDARGRGLRPGIVVLDDKWQTAYGTNEPDPEKWPDLKGWIAQRHAAASTSCSGGRRGTRRAAAGALHPQPRREPSRGRSDNPPRARRLARTLRALLGPDGLDADGLKIDFTARTPSGRASRRTGRAGGSRSSTALDVVYAAAKEPKPDALVMITQTPHPGVRRRRGHDPAERHDRRYDSVVPQMTFRAEVTRAQHAELLIDTDDWRIPSLAAWREYLEVKHELGVPRSTTRPTST